MKEVNLNTTEADYNTLVVKIKTNPEKLTKNRIDVSNLLSTGFLLKSRA